MAGRALVVVEELGTRASNGVITMALDAGTRRAVEVATATFDEVFAEPAVHLAGIAAVVLTAWTNSPSDTATYFRPTQTPAACAASMAVDAGANRITAVMPSGVDEEFPLLLAIHLRLAGVDMILDFLDIMTHEHADAMVDPTIEPSGGKVPTQEDLDTLHKRISEIKNQGHPGWRFDDFNLIDLRHLAAEHPQLASIAANEAVKVSRVKKLDPHLFTTLTNATSAALGFRGAATAQVTLFDLRAFLAFDLHPRTLLGLARAARSPVRARRMSSQPDVK